MNTNTLIALGAAAIIGTAFISGPFSTSAPTAASVPANCQFDLKPYARYMEILVQANDCPRLVLKHHYPDGNIKEEAMSSQMFGMRVLQMDALGPDYFLLRDTDAERADKLARTRLYPAN